MPKFEEYAILDAQIKHLESQKDALRAEITKDILESDDPDIGKTAWGKFSVSMLKSWTYPDDVLKLNEDYKVAKGKAESTGRATYEEKPSLRFTEVKI
jgi:hypothetical protein